MRRHIRRTKFSLIISLIGVAISAYHHHGDAAGWTTTGIVLAIAGIYATGLNTWRIIRLLIRRW